ncbi:hypothetical protein CHS0354_022902 [Potamilus streckersoni]|uniref:Glycine-rich protein n=1 Tax=Potamilus streckersoni TaxID=2493646 RepID=A0AAE0S232_9BIVA|nr:hypothetical protein CHS0354_022902 [Potamilus streckersoni]
MNTLVISCFVVICCFALVQGQGTTGADAGAAGAAGSTGSTGQMGQLATLMALSGGGRGGGSSRGGMSSLFSNPMMRMALLSGGGSDAMTELMTFRCLSSATMDPMCMMLLFNGGLGGMF